MKQYKHKSSPLVYTEIFSDDFGSLLEWSTIGDPLRAWVEKGALENYTEYKEPVIEYRYARVSRFQGYVTASASLIKGRENIKITFTDGELTGVEIIKE